MSADIYYRPIGAGCFLFMPGTIEGEKAASEIILFAGGLSVFCLIAIPLIDAIRKKGYSVRKGAPKQYKCNMSDDKLLAELGIV